VRFIGLDLAWSRRNRTGAVALEEDGTALPQACREDLREDAQIVQFVRTWAGDGPALVAIDAPLIVPNAEGSRPVDREITRRFGRYCAGCYPAYRNRPGGCVRGEEIVAALAREGFVQEPMVQRHATARAVFEVYPHPATVSLFRLSRTIQYKPRSNRSLDFRRGQLKRLRHHLVSLEHSEPAMTMPPLVKSKRLGKLAAADLKRYEDLLDAAICAYIAYYAWYWGPPGYRVYGDLAQGYILVPMTAWMLTRLQAEA